MAEVALVAVAVPIVGAAGVAATIESVLAENSATEPILFVAVTLHLQVLPTRADVIVNVLLIAPTISLVPCCH